MSKRFASLPLHLSLLKQKKKKESAFVDNGAQDGPSELEPSSLTHLPQGHTPMVQVQDFQQLAGHVQTLQSQVQEAAAVQPCVQDLSQCVQVLQQQVNQFSGIFGKIQQAQEFLFSSASSATADLYVELNRKISELEV